MIQDSGTRREFETGAVRDIAEGKGRCDLLPLDIVSKYLWNDTILYFIDCFVSNGSTDCIYNIFNLIVEEGEYKMFPNHYTMILELSKHFEDGCNKYGYRNWEKGIPAHCYIDSSCR